jgi:hypothetical protein
MEFYNLFSDLKLQIDDSTYFNIEKYAPEVPDNIRIFIGRLSMLHGVPFHYIVPDERLLVKYRNAVDGTKEEEECGAFRFFWIDPMWVESLLDGALSIGESEDVEILLKKAMEGNYMAEAFKNEMVAKFRKQLSGSYSLKEFRIEMLKRMKLKGIRVTENGSQQVSESLDDLSAGGKVPVEEFDKIPEPTNAQNNWRFTGFLIRSSLISGWPGLEIQAYGKDQLTDIDSSVHELQLVRMEKIGEDTFFCLCEGIITKVVITQPPENLHFGINWNNDEKIYKMNVSAKTSVDDKATNIEVPMKNTDTRVLDIEQLITRIETALEQQGITGQSTSNGKSFTSADFAMQMVATPIKNTIHLSWNHEEHLNSKII